MARLYVALDVNYAEDDKIIDAGPMAELLYVRALAFAKRARSDGIVRDSQLPSVAARIPRVSRLSDRLIDVGLWERNGAGIYISAWLKRNLPVAEINEAKSTAGTIGNHQRWHIGPSGKPNPDCVICVAEGLT